LPFIEFSRTTALAHLKVGIFAVIVTKSSAFSWDHHGTANASDHSSMWLDGTDPGEKPDHRGSNSPALNREWVEDPHGRRELLVAVHLPAS
jgi:hypothetical protein